MSRTNEVEKTEITKDERGAAAGCCGGAAPKGSKACCVLDAEVKATGGAGCGCASSSKKGCC